MPESPFGLPGHRGLLLRHCNIGAGLGNLFLNLWAAAARIGVAEGSLGLG